MTIPDALHTPHSVTPVPHQVVPTVSSATAATVIPDVPDVSAAPDVPADVANSPVASPVLPPASSPRVASPVSSPVPSPRVASPVSPPTASPHVTSPHVPSAAVSPITTAESSVISSLVPSGNSSVIPSPAASLGIGSPLDPFLDFSPIVAPSDSSSPHLFNATSPPLITATYDFVAPDADPLPLFPAMTSPPVTDTPQVVDPLDLYAASFGAPSNILDHANATPSPITPGDFVIPADILASMNNLASATSAATTSTAPIMTTMDPTISTTLPSPLMPTPAESSQSALAPLPPTSDLDNDLDDFIAWYENLIEEEQQE